MSPSPWEAAGPLCAPAVTASPPPGGPGSKQASGAPSPRSRPRGRGVAAHLRLCPVSADEPRGQPCPWDLGAGRVLQLSVIPQVDRRHSEGPLGKPGRPGDPLEAVLPAERPLPGRTLIPGPGAPHRQALQVLLCPVPPAGLSGTRPPLESVTRPPGGARWPGRWLVSVPSAGSDGDAIAVPDGTVCAGGLGSWLALAVAGGTVVAPAPPLPRVQPL